MKLTPTESWDNGVFEITEILYILSMCLTWEGNPENLNLIVFGIFGQKF